MSDTPEAFDWVRARHECSLDNLFNQLRLQAKSAVEQRNEQVKDKLFGLSEGQTSKPTFSVFKTYGYGRRAVDFLLEADHIAITGTGLKDGVVVTATLCDDKVCRCNVNGEPREVWQVLRLTLEAFLFGRD